MKLFVSKYIMYFGKKAKSGLDLEAIMQHLAQGCDRGVGHLWSLEEVKTDWAASS